MHTSFKCLLNLIIAILGIICRYQFLYQTITLVYILLDHEQL